MVQPRKTGHLVGAMPKKKKKRLVLLAVGWAGPLGSRPTRAILSRRFLFGVDPLTMP